MSLLLVRKLLKLLSKQERYMSVTPIRIVLAVILIPLIALMIIAPRITKELLLLGKHLKDFIKSQNIPWKRMLEEKLKEYIQQGKAVELTMEGMSEMIIPNTIKAVSYTHLDVYKRQAHFVSSEASPIPALSCPASSAPWIHSPGNLEVCLLYTSLC